MSTHEESVLTALANLEKIAFSGRFSEAHACLTELWPFIGDGVAAIQDPGAINVFSGIALGYLRLGKRANARTFANNALIVSPADPLAHAISPLPDRINIVRQFLHHKQPHKATELLETIRALTPTAAQEVAFYSDVLRFFETEKAKARQLAPLDGDATLFCLAVWGAHYVDRFLRFALPSLLAPGNVPALAEAGPVAFDIFTTAADRRRLLEAPGIHALAERARIDFTICPDALIDFEPTEGTNAPDRLLVAGAQCLAATRAKTLRADLAYVCTEGLYSDRHFSTAKAYLNAGYKAVLMNSLRAKDGDLPALLEARDAVEGNAIVVDAHRLVDYAVDHLSPQARDLFIRPDSRTVDQDPVALYFRTETGFTARSFQLSPALIGHEILLRDFEFDYHTADSHLLAELARGRDPSEIYKVIDDPAADLFVADLDAGSSDAARVFGAFPVTVEQCVRSLMKWCNLESDFRYFEWAFAQRIDFRCDPGRLPDNGDGETEAVSEFLALFRDSQDDGTRTIRFYRNEVGTSP